MAGSLPKSRSSLPGGGRRGVGREQQVGASSSENSDSVGAWSCRANESLRMGSSTIEHYSCVALCLTNLSKDAELRPFKCHSVAGCRPRSAEDPVEVDPPGSDMAGSSI